MNLRQLPDLVVAEVLYGIHQRRLEKRQTLCWHISAIAEQVRLSGAGSLLELDAEIFTGARRMVCRSLQDHVHLICLDPQAMFELSVWDLRILGLPGARPRRVDFNVIEQPWLRDLTKRWVAVAAARLSVTRIQTCVRSMGSLSESLSYHDAGQHPEMVSRSDIEAWLLRLNRRGHSRGRTDTDTRKVDAVRLVLDDCRAAGHMEHVNDGFAVLPRLDTPKRVESEEASGKALPEYVVDYLSAEPALAVLRSIANKRLLPVGPRLPEQRVLMFRVLRDTGRRTGEVCALRHDCLERDSVGRPLLIYDNVKAGRMRRRLPIDEALYSAIEEQRDWVRQAFPETPPSQLALFPRINRNPSGVLSIDTGLFNLWLRNWFDLLPPILDPRRDPASPGPAFERKRLFAYAFRHTYAQRLADEGVSVDVLKELLDHRRIETTLGYYQVGMERRREAADHLSSTRVDRHGRQVLSSTSELTPIEHIGDSISEVAVPWGMCSEPSNVKAGGQECALRFRCLGCDHFSSDASFLPELRAHLDELVGLREAGIALGADSWALVHTNEISKLRNLIEVLEGELASLPEEDRRVIGQASADIRKARSSVPVVLGRRR